MRIRHTIEHKEHNGRTTISTVITVDGERIGALTVVSCKTNFASHLNPETNTLNDYRRAIANSLLKPM